MTRIFLVGYYGVANLGDDAIRAAIEAAAPSVGATIDRIAVRWAPGAPPPQDDPRHVRLGLRGFPRYLAAIARADRVVLGGGGLLKDEGMRLILDLAVTVLVARLLRKRVTLLAVGVGPLYTSLGRRLVRLVARLSAIRTVRDEASAELLVALGIDDVRVGADPVFAGDAASPASASPTAEAAPHLAATGSVRPRRVVVAIRPWFFTVGSGGTMDAFRGALVAGLGPLLESGAAVEFVALYRPRDAVESERVAASLPMGIDATVSEPGDWPALLAAVDSADLVLAMRYHALAAAAARGRPAVALAYEPKVRALATDLGVPALDVGAPSFADDLVDALAAWLSGAADLRPVGERVVELRERARDAIRLALLG